MVLTNHGFNSLLALLLVLFPTISLVGFIWWENVWQFDSFDRCVHFLFIFFACVSTSKEVEVHAAFYDAWLWKQRLPCLQMNAGQFPRMLRLITLIQESVCVSVCAAGFVQGLQVLNYQHVYWCGAQLYSHGFSNNKLMLMWCASMSIRHAHTYRHTSTHTYIEGQKCWASTKCNVCEG